MEDAERFPRLRVSSTSVAGESDLLARQSAAIYSKTDPGGFNLSAACARQGIIAYYSGNMTESEHFIRQSLIILQRLSPDSQYTAYNVEMLGLVAWHRGDFKAAEALIKHALKISRKADPHGAIVVNNLINLGIVMRSVGRDRIGHDYRRGGF